MSRSAQLDMDKLIPRCLLFVFDCPDEDSKLLSDNLTFEEQNFVEAVEKIEDSFKHFDEFVSQNKGCFWDPHLEESLSNVKVNGVLFPLTLLVTGRDIHLDTIARAWSKRVLRSTQQYQLKALGTLDVALSFNL